jgi:hypothetical protein
MLDFTKIRFDDAEIVRVHAVEDQLHVIYRDWKEQQHTLIFECVAGYQWFSPEGKALSHGTIETRDPLIDLACEMADEDNVEGFKIFSFVSAWNEAKLLRVVGKKIYTAE